MRYWRIIPGRAGWAKEECRSRNVIAIGTWGLVECDLSQVPAADEKALRMELRARNGKLPTKERLTPQGVAAAAKATWRLLHEIGEGDRVCLYYGKTVFAVGIVEGGYAFVEDDFDHPHRRLVQWLDKQDRPVHKLPAGVQKKLRQHATVVELTASEWRELAGLFPGTAEPPPPPPPPGVLDDVRRCLISRGLHFTDSQIAAFYTALQTKGFVILSGISGTGKTKLAQQFAELLPGPAGQGGLPEEFVETEVRDYMLKRKQIVVPRRLGEFDASKAKEPPPVQVVCGGVEAVCPLAKYGPAGSRTLTLLLRSPVAEQFAKTFRAGEAVVLYREMSYSIMGTRLRIMTRAEAEALHREQVGSNHLFVSVRPDWRDGKPLLGYCNPLMNERRETEFTEFVRRAVESYRRKDGLAWFVILDEMNLARVEYYFAELLSVLESGRDELGWTREGLSLEWPPQQGDRMSVEVMKLPPNLYVVGTVNVDETTHGFSPKVLDRTFTIELMEVDFGTYVSYLPAPVPSEGETATAAGGTPALPGGTATDRQRLLEGFTRGGRFAVIEKERVGEYTSAHPEVTERLGRLNELLRPHDLHFGYRVFDEIVMFLVNAEESGIFGKSGDAFDAAVLMKVLPKFHGSRAKLEPALRKALAWCLDPDQPAMGQVGAALQEAQSASPSTPAGDAAAERLEKLPYRLPQTAERTRRLLRAAYNDGFAAFG